MESLEKNIKKFLKADPLPWLLETSDPCISYLTKRDILDIKFNNNDYFAYIKQSSLSVLLEEKTVGDPHHFDMYIGGALWKFAEAVEKGADIRLESIKQTAFLLMEKTQVLSGGFTIHDEPEIPLSCRTGDYVRLLIKAGIHDERISKGIEWICSHQREDGGWLHCPIATVRDQLSFIFFNRPGSGLSRETGNTQSCIYATASCAMALIEYSRSNFAQYHCQNVILKAAHFLLSLKLGITRPASHACYFNPRKTDFSLLGYPLLAQYDILLGALLTASTPLRHDPRAVDAFNRIISKQDDKGRWIMENRRQGMMPHDTGSAARSSKWVTLNVLRLLKEMSSGD